MDRTRGAAALRCRQELLDSAATTAAGRELLLQTVAKTKLTREIKILDLFHANERRGVPYENTFTHHTRGLMVIPPEPVMNT
jgi:hypothetical protein